jgi:hypothetical protein
MPAKTLNYKPFLGFVLAYSLLFYFLGHLDAMHSIELAEDYYFGFLTMVGLFIFLSMVSAYKLFESKFLNFNEFVMFSGFATLMLPVSVWGLAWVRWFTIKTGNLTLWNVGVLKISIPWKIFIPFHISMTLLFVIITFFIIYKKIKS